MLIHPVFGVIKEERIEILDASTVLLRFSLAAFLGAIIGLERETHGRSAGLRTSILVATGTTLMMMVSQHIFELYKGYSDQSVIRIDPARIASYAVSGMGFIGAGVIIKGRGSVRGITTASCLWMVTAIGLAVGSGYYTPAILAGLLSTFTLLAFDHLKRHVNRNLYTEMIIRSDDIEGQLENVRKLLEKHRAKILFIGFSKDLSQQVVTFFLHLRMREKADWQKLAEEICLIAGLRQVDWKEGHVP